MRDHEMLEKEEIFSKVLRAGRRTYFFDVRETRGNDYYLTITESRKKFDSDGYDRHKIFLYKEDFNKFVKGLGEAVDFVKTELMPDFDFDAFNHDTPYEGEEANTEMAPKQEGLVAETPAAETVSPIVEDTTASNNGSTEEVDKW